jgi:hypothetical protein
VRAIGHVAKSVLLGLQVETDRIAGATQTLGSPTRRNVHPGFTGFATKASEKPLECCDNRLEILLSEVGPLVIVDGLVDCSILDIRCAGRGGQRRLALPGGFLIGVVSP